LKNVNIKTIFNKLTIDKINKFISIYELMKTLNDGEEVELIKKEYSKEYQNNIINDIIKIYEKNIKIYKAYISKLYSYFNKRP
jgi:hypothetical protein